MKLVFEFGYADSIVLASTKDEQTMIELLSRATVCRKKYDEHKSYFEKTDDVVKVTFIQPNLIVDKIEE